MTIAPTKDHLDRWLDRMEGRAEGVAWGRKDGRREMLWLMAVGAACLYALTDDWEMAAVAHEMRCYALGALVDAGDTRAREYM